jgi:hypothetical protein
LIPIRIPDTRIGLHSNRFSHSILIFHRYRSSIDTDLLSIFHRYRSSIDTAIDTDLPSIPPSIPIFHRYRSSIATDLPSIPIFHSIYDPFLIVPVSGFSLQIPLIQIFHFKVTNRLRANNFKFSTSILPFFTVLFTGEVQFGG